MTTRDVKEIEDRYKKLGLRDSIVKTYQYTLACHELSSFLRLAFLELPKFLQHLVLDDVVFAFQTLPQMEASSAVEAANLLLQAAESALPKQKRAMAVKEFKHAMVAHKRRWKSRQQGEGMSQLPQDVLILILSFLDLRSLVAAASVSRSWRVAASDNKLWQLQYSIFFAGFDNHNEIKVLQSRQVEAKHICIETDVTRASIDWREAFRRDYKGMFSKIFNASSRGYCKHCSTIVWLNDLEITNKHCGSSCVYYLINPISTHKIVKYVINDSCLWISSYNLEDSRPWISSDSDSDCEEWFSSRLWAHPWLSENF